jgi:hypothetical protein
MQVEYCLLVQAGAPRGSLGARQPALQGYTPMLCWSWGGTPPHTQWMQPGDASDTGVSHVLKFGTWMGKSCVGVLGVYWGGRGWGVLL